MDKEELNVPSQQELLGYLVQTIMYVWPSFVKQNLSIQAMEDDKLYFRLIVLTYLRARWSILLQVSFGF